MEVTAELIDQISLMVTEERNITTSLDEIINKFHV